MLIYEKKFILVMNYRKYEDFIIKRLLKIIKKVL